MDCPKNIIKACFLYLDRMEKEGKLLLRDGDIEKIIKDVEKEFEGYMESVQKYEKKIQKLPYPELPQFHIVSKYLISGANFVKEKGTVSLSDETKKIVSMKSDHDINAEIEVFTVYADAEKDLQNRITESISLENDNLAYFGVDSTSDGLKNVESIVMGHISSYLEQYHGQSNIFDREEKQNLSNVIIGIALRLSKNEYVSSRGNNPVDYKMLLDEKTIDDIKEAIASMQTLKNTIDREHVDIEGVIGYIKDEVNRDFKEFLTSIPLLRSSSHKALIDEFSTRYRTDANSSFLEGFQKAKGMQLEVSFTPVDSQFNFFYSKGTRNSSEMKFVTISTELEYLTEDLNRKEIKSVKPKEITVDVSKTTVSTQFTFDDDVPLVKECSERSDRKYFYNSSLSDGRIKIEVVDESDSAPKGGGATVMRDIARNASNIIAGTGTGITGTAKSVVGQIAYSGTIDNIEELERQYTELCGVFEIKSPYVRLLTSLIRSDSEIALYFKNSVVQIREQFQKKDRNNLDKIYDEFTKEIIQKCSFVGLNVEDVNVFDARNSTRAILESLAKDKDIKSGGMSGVQLIEHCLYAPNNNFVKEVSGIQAGILTSLINSQSDTNIGITTRENLTGLKESINFIDSNVYHNVSGSIKSKEKPAIMQAFDKNNLSVKIQKEYLYKNAEKNYTSQIQTFLRANFDFFIKALKSKDSGGLNNLALVSAVADQTSNDFIFNISKSGTSTNDDVVSLYAEYLSNNGEFSEKTLLKLKSSSPDGEDRFEGMSEEEIKKAKKYEKEREKYIKENGLTECEMLNQSIDAFHACVKVFQEEFLEKTVLRSRMTDSEIDSDNQNRDDGEVGQSVYEMNYYLPKELYNLYGDSTGLTSFVSFKDAYPYKTEDNSKIIFSIPTTFMKEKWKEFAEEPVFYQTSLTNSELKDIVDNFTSKGKEELLCKSIAKDKEKAVVVSSRKIASVFNLYDIVSVASQRNEQDKPLIIMPVSTPDIEEAVRNIDKDFLKRYNIDIKTVKSENVATEISKANSKQLQYVLVSNYTPIARGLSLAETDRTIITNPIAKKGDGIQLLARGINPSKKILETNINLHDGGENIDLSIKYGANAGEINDFLGEVSELIAYKDGRLYLSDENHDLESLAVEIADNNKLCSVGRTYTDKINDELREANKVYKGFTSGEYADTKETSFEKILVLTNPYIDKFQSQSVSSSEDAELDIDNLHQITS
jgi:hypothetical protein